MQEENVRTRRRNTNASTKRKWFWTLPPTSGMCRRPAEVKAVFEGGLSCGTPTRDRSCELPCALDKSFLFDFAGPPFTGRQLANATPTSAETRNARHCCMTSAGYFAGYRCCPTRSTRPGDGLLRPTSPRFRGFSLGLLFKQHIPLFSNYGSDEHAVPTTTLLYFAASGHFAGCCPYQRHRDAAHGPEPTLFGQRIEPTLLDRWSR